MFSKRRTDLESVEQAQTRALLVEDCPDQQRLYIHFLKQVDCEVTLECNGQAAVERIRRDPNHYSAILMDFRMPEMDGLQATRAIRGAGFIGTIIAATSYGSDSLREQWFEAGCDAFIDKPITQNELREVLADPANFESD